MLLAVACVWVPGCADKLAVACDTACRRVVQAEVKSVKRHLQHALPAL